MPFDPTTIPSEARAIFIKDGARFGSEDTLDQANQTLNAFNVHGPKLANYGFTAADAQELEDARDALITAGVGRQAKRTSKKVDTAALAMATRDAQGARLRARAVAHGTQRVLLLAGKTDAVQKIDAVLDRDSAAATDSEALAQQLDALRDLLRDAVIADVAKNRGGTNAINDLEVVAAALRDAAKVKAEPQGTPVETETLDLIDGVIVSLARLAREAAEAAARESSEPAMAAAFELSALYKRRTKSKDNTTAPDETSNG